MSAFREAADRLREDDRKQGSQGSFHQVFPVTEEAYSPP
jgi:hypothetical protein